VPRFCPWFLSIENIDAQNRKDAADLIIYIFTAIYHLWFITNGGWWWLQIFIDAVWFATGPSNVENMFEPPYFEWYQANKVLSSCYSIPVVQREVSRPLCTGLEYGLCCNRSVDVFVVLFYYLYQPDSSSCGLWVEIKFHRLIAAYVIDITMLIWRFSLCFISWTSTAWGSEKQSALYRATEEAEEHKNTKPKHMASGFPLIIRCF